MDLGCTHTDNVLDVQFHNNIPHLFWNISFLCVQPTGPRHQRSRVPSTVTMAPMFKVVSTEGQKTP